MTEVDFTNSRGVIVTPKPNNGTRKDYLYRISVKAMIYNEQGELLLTREAGRDWHLPGGGMDYSENIEEALKRELHEEIGYTGGLTYRVIGADPMWMDNLEVYQMWLVVLVEPENMNFSVGSDGEGICFMDTEALKSYSHIDSRRTLKFHHTAQEIINTRKGN